MSYMIESKENLERATVESDKQRLETDLLWAKNCARQDRKSMHLLYETYGPKILTLCRRYSSSQEEALDCLHEGFLKVFEKINSYRGESPLFPWVRAVIVNNTINLMKKKVKYEFIEIEDLQEEPENEEPEKEIPDPEEVIRLIQELPSGYRMVLNLYVFEKMSHDAIASTLGISVSTSKSQLFKARKYLKSHL